MSDKTHLPYPISGVPVKRASGGGGISVFDTSEALELNRARLDHLDSLNLPVSGKNVLDVGAGVGHLARYFVERGCRVVCLEGRAANVEVLRSRYPDVESHVADVETDSLAQFGRFDIVFCYGLLYHLESPVGALRNMAAVCDELMLLETVISDQAEPIVRLVDEPAETPNQALGGLGGRPSPSFVAMALTRAGFPFVYAPRVPPNHPDFRFEWENNLDFSRDGRLMRCVFVASRSRLENQAFALLLAGPEAGPVKPFVEPARDRRPARVWLDVGAHLGEKTFSHACEDPSLQVYAFEPNLGVALRRMGALPNFVVVPAAVAEQDGSADFFVSSLSAASSLLPFHPEGVSRWIGGEELKAEKTVTVPTMRLDTFLNASGIDRVEYLKIDARGADFAVVRSAGERLKDVGKISLEVQITPAPLYAGGSDRNALIRYMDSAGFELVSAARQSHGQEENLTFVNRCQLQAPRERMSDTGLFSPAAAYWNQRAVLAESRDRILALSRAVDRPSDLWPYQWAQLMAAALEYQPDLILELGRGAGNSTCAFTEAANQMEPGCCRVLSLCLSKDWEVQTVRRLKPIVPASWFEPLRAVRTDILTFDYHAALAGVKKVLIFWDAEGFDVAECVLGAILPELADREHLVIVHDLSDLRYSPPEAMNYGENSLWKGRDCSGPRLKIGHIDSAVEQAIAILDFASRNGLTLESADHSNHSEFDPDPATGTEMSLLLGEELFDLQGHWFYFSLNEHPGPYTFPKFTRPDRIRRLSSR